MRKPLLYKVPSGKSVGDAAIALQAAAQTHGYSVMQVYNLTEIMAQKGVVFAHECLIFEVCNPQQAGKVLTEDIGISTALPCRISIYEKGGSTMLATTKPTTVMAMFNVPQLEPVALEIEDDIIRIMKQAAV